jgi:hypothetical protein
LGEYVPITPSIMAFPEFCPLLLIYEIEAINIKYGKIENCKIDTILTSKIWRRLTSKINDGNIEFNFENGNIDSKTGSNGAPVGSNGVIASPIIISRGAPHPHPKGTPFDPVFTVAVTVFEVKFDVTAFDIKVVSILNF